MHRRGPEPILWRRLDVPGHDVASLRITPAGAELSGMAVFDAEIPTALAYSVECDASWSTTSARVWGRRGANLVDLRLRRDAGGTWAVNDMPCPVVHGCTDVDLNFTPATNLLPLRRLTFPVNQTVEVRSAWLEWPDLRLTPLVQRYVRRSATKFDYEADLPGGQLFQTVLRVQPDGWVLDYGELWQTEAQNSGPHSHPGSPHE